jgi:hypothetical protein
MARKVLVTTAHRGIFFGELIEANGTTLSLANCRNCLYWEKAVRGFLGLAVTGPLEGCRVGPAAERTQLFDVTSVSDCSAEAIERWEAEVWNEV